MTTVMTTVKQLQGYACQLDGMSDSAALDTELLLCYCLDKPRSYLRAWPEADVDGSQLMQFQSLFNRRLKGEPVAHLIGERGFWSLDLKVNASTLIPRPETELLVELALDFLGSNSRANVLDLGTGTGAIALAIAKEKPQWQLLACDTHQAAVELAQRNQQDLALNNVRIIRSDWFEQIDAQLFDLIVSNPPYIDADDPHLEQGDVRFEPRSALVAADNGLADIALIIRQARRFLVEGGWLLIEHGYDQAQPVGQLFSNQGFNHVFCQQDLAGCDRVSGGQFFSDNSRDCSSRVE
jgi:release factor glutamine methyltransferase